MDIGIPKEIKTREGRVALPPVGVMALVFGYNYEEYRA